MRGDQVGTIAGAAKAHKHPTPKCRGLNEPGPGDRDRIYDGMGTRRLREMLKAADSSLEDMQARKIGDSYGGPSVEERRQNLAAISARRR